MATRTLSGWTPGSPIDGQRLRLYREQALAGTYLLNYDATSVQVAVVPGDYQGELRSTRETEESEGSLTVQFNVPSSFGGGGPPPNPPPTPSEDPMATTPPDTDEDIPPPTGTIAVSDP